MDGGVTWVPGNRILTDIKGIRASGTNKDMRVASFPCLTVDLSEGPNRGTLYVVWANIGVPGINTGNDIDIYISNSTNQGDTWSTPVRVNQDPVGLGKNHFLPWLTCDPLNGNLCVIYYDDRNVNSNQVETWVSYSYDAGNSWTDFRVSDVAFTPSPIPGMAADYFGDYIGIKAQNMKVYPIWTDNRAGNALTYVSPFTLGPPPNQPYVSYYSHELESIPTELTQNMNYGDSLYLTLGLKNIGDQPADNLFAVLSTESPFIIITDATESYGTMQPDEIKTIPNGYSFHVSDSIPDGLKVKFHVTVSNGDTSWKSQFSIESHAPSLRMVSMTILYETGGNNNGRLDPGETVEVRFNNVNNGDFTAFSSYALLSCSSPFITLQSDSIFLDTMFLGEPKTASFSLIVADEAPTGIGVVLAYQLHSQYHYQEASFLETIGIIVEDCTRVNRSLSAMLDAEDPLEGAYDLEVSSPGLERPLQKHGDFERFCGYRVRVQLEKDTPGRRRFTGTLQPADAGFIQLDVDGEEFQLSLELVEKAHLLLEIEEHRALVEQSLVVHATGESL